MKREKAFRSTASAFSGRDGRGVSRRKDQGIEPPHLLLQESDGVFSAPERSELLQTSSGEVRDLWAGEKFGFHLAKPHTAAATEELPGRLAAGEPPPMMVTGASCVAIFTMISPPPIRMAARRLRATLFAGALYFMMLRHPG